MTVPPRQAPRLLQMGLETPSTRPGGLNRYFSGLCRALVDAGVPVRAITLGGAPEALPDWWERSGSADRPLPWRLWRSYLAARRAGEVDVLDLHFALTALAPLAVRRLRRVPSVVHFQGPWADESRLTGSSGTAQRVKRHVERLVYRRADAHVVLSRAFRRVLLERYGVSPWQISVIPPGVDLVRFGAGDREAARADLGVPADCWMAVCVRRLVPRMGIDVLLEAWRAVERSTHDPVRLVVVGDGPERQALAARSAALGVTGSVRFAGRVDDAELARWYRAADVSVVPSVALEGFGLVVAESLASGTPVVATAVGGLAEAVGPLDQGLLVPPGDSDRLARRLQGARTGSDPLPAADACRQYARRFSWPEVARRHVDLYRSVGRPGVRQRPRVVVVGHTARPSGGELAMLRLLRAMDQVDVHVVLAEDGRLVSLLEEAGISVEVLAMEETSRALSRDRVDVGALPVGAALATGGYVLRLARRLRAIRPDLVHTNTLKAALYGGVAARLVGVPCLWHIRDRIERDYLPGPAVRLVRGAARRLPAAVVANSAPTLATVGLPPGAGTVVPSPVDVTAAGLARAARTAGRGQGPGGGLRVGIVGRLAPWKGQDVFVRAFARAFPDEAAEAVVVGSALFGEGDFEAAVKSLVAELGLDGRVDFRGFREDVASELSRLDVLVHASVIPEPFGQVVVEGMAAGLPVLAAAAGGPAEILTDGVDGLLYPPGDVDALAAHLRRLAADPALREALGAEAMRAAERYRPEVVASQVLEVYREVLGRRRGPMG